VAHIHDLVSMVLGATRDAAEIAIGRGLQAARLHALKADIAVNLIRRDLSINAVAARQAISPRYVRRLFAEAGSSFSDFVLVSRLERVRRILCDWRNVERSVSDIAFACGFGDLSYFYKSFRRRYGMTPSDVREAARRQHRD
jgi:AraC-like DNA-binding protein